jgi:hypothetical protein
VRTIALLGASVLALAATSSGLQAQEVWSLDVRGGAAFPTQDFGVDELDTGVGFEGTIAYRFMPHLWVYGGWDWYHFQADQALSLVDVDVEETGYAFGLRFEHPIERFGSPSIWLRVGGTYNHIEIEDHDDTTADSGHGLGFEAGAGVALRLGDRWYLTPGARFRALTREFVVSGVGTDVDLTYVALEVGLSRRF